MTDCPFFIHIKVGLCVTDESCFQNAKEQELKKWKSNNPYIEVAKSDQPLLNCRWVCSMKNTDDKQIPKTHLVVKGFEEQKSDILKDSSTCSKEGLCFVLTLIAHNGWEINSIDIKTAFLQDEETDRDLFFIPKRSKYAQYLVLKKCSYGLVNASRKWYNKVKSVLLSLNLKMSKGDPSLFYYYQNDKLLGIVAIHVNDFLWAGEYHLAKILYLLFAEFL